MMKHRYLWELGISLGAYAVALVASLYLLADGRTGASLRPVLSLLPMIPALAICWAVVRQLRRMDELQRKIQFEALGLAFAATAIATFSYGFLENVGFPRISMFAVWPLMAGFWIIGGIVSRRRYA